MFIFASAYFSFLERVYWVAQVVFELTASDSQALKSQVWAAMPSIFVHSCRDVHVHIWPCATYMLGIGSRWHCMGLLVHVIGYTYQCGCVHMWICGFTPCACSNVCLLLFTCAMCKHVCLCVVLLTCAFTRICIRVHMCQVHVCTFGFYVSVDRCATYENVCAYVCACTGVCLRQRHSEFTMVNPNGGCW